LRLSHALPENVPRTGTGTILVEAMMIASKAYIMLGKGLQEVL